jgi:ketosteroid isomerase-like protein
MKSSMIKAIAIGVLFVMSASVFAQTQQETRAMIAKKNQEIIDLAKAGKYEAMEAYYDKNAISLPNYRVMEKGFALILNNALGRAKGGYQIVDGKKTTTDMIIGVEMIVDIGSYNLLVNFPGLAEPKMDMGKYMNVWQKQQDGSWKIVAETWNADKSPNAPQTKPGQAAGAPGSTIKVNQGAVTNPTGTQQPKK